MTRAEDLWMNQSKWLDGDSHPFQARTVNPVGVVIGWM
jgi:hypothetical protein